MLDVLITRFVFSEAEKVAVVVFKIEDEKLELDTPCIFINSHVVSGSIL